MYCVVVHCMVLHINKKACLILERSYVITTKQIYSKVVLMDALYGEPEGMHGARFERISLDKENEGTIPC